MRGNEQNLLNSIEAGGGQFVSMNTARKRVNKKNSQRNPKRKSSARERTIRRLLTELKQDR